MCEKKERNNPRSIFKEQDDLVVARPRLPVGGDELASIRRSGITSIVPDDINWNNIYVGKQHGLHSTKPEPDSDRK